MLAFLNECEPKKAVHRSIFSNYILRTETKTSSAKDQRIFYIIKKYFHVLRTYKKNSASLVVIFVLFCFVLIWDESVTSSFNQKYQKSFYSYNKNKLFSYDIIRGIQQATSISFFSFFGESTRELNSSGHNRFWISVSSFVIGWDQSKFGREVMETRKS